MRALVTRLPGPMDLTFPEPEPAFRDELRRGLADTPPAPKPEDSGEEAHFAWRRDWQRRLYDGGWAAPHWPAEYGGRGAAPARAGVFFQEAGRARAPPPPDRLRLLLRGPPLMGWGNREQEEGCLPPPP